MDFQMRDHLPCKMEFIAAWTFEKFHNAIKSIS